jgi:hypothetical protein
VAPRNELQFDRAFVDVVGVQGTMQLDRRAATVLVRGGRD